MPKTLGIVIAIFATVGGLVAGSATKDNSETIGVPRLVVTAMRAIPGMVQIQDSITDTNPHMVIAYLKPAQGDRIELTRYVVVPGEPAEWVEANWEDYRFRLMVTLRGSTNADARIITSLDGIRVADQSLFLNVRQAPPDPEDPGVLRARLEQSQDRASKLSDLAWRILSAEFEPPNPNDFDLGCTLATNRWGLTNEWVVRELDHDLIKARYPTDLDPREDERAAQFFSLWQKGDRLIACAMPKGQRTQWSGWYGYIIVRDCEIVARLTIIRV